MLGPDIPGSYAMLLFIALDFTSITSHMHNWVLFLLWLCLFSLSGVIFPLISSCILGTYQLGKFIFQCPICLFILFIWFSRQEYWSGLPFPSPVDHVLSELSTMTRPSWVAHTGHDPQCHWVRQGVVYVISLISFLWLWFYFVCSLMNQDKMLRKLPDGRDWLWGKLGLALMGGAMFRKSLIQFSLDGWGCVPSL